MKTTLRRRLAALAGALLLALGAGAALAGAGAAAGDMARHGHGPAHGAGVLPAAARPHGYSLEDMARLTAAFNVTDRSGPLPNTPFQILYSSSNGPDPFRVGQGTMLYVPVAYNDDSLPVIGDFPNVENRRELLRYWFSQRQWGAVYTEIVVDGKVYSLGGAYLAGVRFAEPLPDGARQYMTPAAFVGPLRPGAHTVEIRAKATGDAFREDPVSQYFPDGFFQFSTVYNVVVY